MKTPRMVGSSAFFKSFVTEGVLLQDAALIVLVLVFAVGVSGFQCWSVA